MKNFHTCEKMPEGYKNDAVYFGSTFEGFPDADPIEWHLDLGMEWCHVDYCPWCGVRLTQRGADLSKAGGSARDRQGIYNESLKKK